MNLDSVCFACSVCSFGAGVFLFICNGYQEKWAVSHGSPSTGGADAAEQEKDVKRNSKKVRVVFVSLIVGLVTAALLYMGIRAREGEDPPQELGDGVYTPDKFSWSGGTGRVSISCDKIMIRNGQAYATIVFSSGSYSYVKENGQTYYGTNTESTSTFEIPVELNKNNRIFAMTTKMSAAHEIEYSIFVYLAAADGEKSAAVGAGDGEMLDEEAPKIQGLTYQEETELSYAEYFKLYRYDQGITLLEIDLESDTDFQAEELEEEAKMYGHNVVKYLLVPEEVEIPAGLDKEMAVLHLPVQGIYMEAKETPDFLKQLGQTEKIVVGSGEELDYKMLLSSGTDLVILSSEVLQEKTETGEDGERMKEIRKLNQKLQETAEYLSLLKIPMIVDRSADEKGELAQLEWIKVYGAMLGCEEKAAAVFEAAAKEGEEK